MAVYFTNEAEARAGERREPPAVLKAQMDEVNAPMKEPPIYFDLTDPWLFSAR